MPDKQDNRELTPFEQQFEKYPIRRIWHKGKWYYSAINASHAHHESH